MTCGCKRLSPLPPWGASTEKRILVGLALGMGGDDALMRFGWTWERPVLHTA